MPKAICRLHQVEIVNEDDPMILTDEDGNIDLSHHYCPGFAKWAEDNEPKNEDGYTNEWYERYDKECDRCNESWELIVAPKATNAG